MMMVGQSNNDVEASQPKTRIGNATAARMASVKAHQEAFARKGQNTEKTFPKIGRGIIAAERMASIKAQQKAFARKGKKTESSIPKIGRGNIAAERMASIKAQQEAFARKGQKDGSSIPTIGRGNIAAERRASIKAQQETVAWMGRTGVETDKEVSVSQLVIKFSSQKKNYEILEILESRSEDIPSAVDTNLKQELSEHGDAHGNKDGEASECECLIPVKNDYEILETLENSSEDVPSAVDTKLEQELSEDSDDKDKDKEDSECQCFIPIFLRMLIKKIIPVGKGFEPR